MEFRSPTRSISQIVGFNRDTTNRTLQVGALSPVNHRGLHQGYRTLQTMNLKGTPNEDSRWHEKVENLKTFRFAGFVLWFYQYLCKQFFFPLRQFGMTEARQASLATAKRTQLVFLISWSTTDPIVQPL